MRKKLIAGNWKMNGGLQQNAAWVRAVLQGLSAQAPDCDVVVHVPALYVAQILELLALNQDKSAAPLRVGVQDVSEHDSGAYTGEVSAAMVRDIGGGMAIVGHSERRQYHAETDHVVARKAKAALACGITPIVCVGETLAEREAGQTENVVKRQLTAVIRENAHCMGEMVLAYEPVWAIGTGKTATPEAAQAVHAVLRQQLHTASATAAQRVRILYGGSMNAANAASLLRQADIDGGLVGGASLQAQDFLAIVAATSAAPTSPL